MKVFRFCFFVFFFSISVFSQENYTQHTVVKGDNIYQIAKKYNVKPQEIVDLNPENSSVLKLDSVLRIPNTSASSISNKSTATTSHKVAQKETLYGISKQYGVSVAVLKENNPTLEKEGLKAEQEILIPINTEVVKKEESVLVEVEQPVKAVAVIPVSNKISKKEQSESVKINSPNKTVTPKNTAPASKAEVVENQYSREVKQKETKYGIAKEYGITVAELEKQNPTIKNALQVGQQLQIKTTKIVETEAIVSEIEVAEIDSNTINEGVSPTLYTLNDELVDQLIVTASENIGTRYRMGGTTKDGFDCSGLMMTTYGDCNVQLPRTSIEQSQFGDKVNFEQAQKGDLIFFKTSSRNRINHVGMVVEADGDEIKFIHASVHGGVMISSTKESYYEKKVAQVNRVLK